MPSAFARTCQAATLLALAASLAACQSPTQPIHSVTWSPDLSQVPPAHLADAKDSTQPLSVYVLFTFEADWATLQKQLPHLTAENITVRGPDGQVIVHQLWDDDQDGTFDTLLFQWKAADGMHSGTRFDISAEGLPMPAVADPAQALIAHNRLDDAAWENAYMACRVYGPPLANRDDHGPGIDAWYKRVRYPILAKWYDQNARGISYHEDHGEGHDIYSVGTSLGAGGMAICTQDTLRLAGKYQTATVLGNGPIRAGLDLTYQTQWEDDQGQHTSKETRRITVDRGQPWCTWQANIEVDGQPWQGEVAIGLAMQGNADLALDHHANNQPSIRTWSRLGQTALGTAAWLPTQSNNARMLLQPAQMPNSATHVLLITTPDAQGQVTWHIASRWGNGESEFDTVGWGIDVEHLVDCSNRQALVGED